MTYHKINHPTKDLKLKNNNNNNNKSNARDTTYFTTKCLQTDMALICHYAISAIKTQKLTAKH